MVNPIYYPLADNKSQNFVNKYPGVAISPNILVLHTMEVNGWPGYQGGEVAPHLSIIFDLNPDGTLKGYKWRQHFPFNRSARAVRNEPGGVETNNSSQGVIQIEMGGTCGWANRDKHVLDPDWSNPEQVKKIAQPIIDFLVWANRNLGLQLVAPYEFYAWNGSGHRMNYKEWLSFKGICGHQHVPENTHIDPGKIDINWIIAEARKVLDADPNNNPPVDPGPTDPGPGNVYTPSRLSLTGRFDQATIKLTQYVIGIKGNDIDGIWGPITKKAFQKWLFVKQDGIIGPNTVKALQKRIKIPAHNIDGIWGPMTNQYLQQYLNAKILV